VCSLCPAPFWAWVGTLVLFAVDVAILVALAAATLVTLQAGWHIHAGVLRGLLLLLQLLALSAVTPVVSPGAAWVGRVFAFVAKGPQNAFVVLCAFGVHHPHERVLAVVWSVCVIAPATATLAALAVALRAVVGVDAVHLHTVCSLERLHRAYVAPPRVVRFDDVLRVLFQRAAACAIVVVAPVHRLAALRMARSALTPADGARGAQMVDAGAGDLRPRGRQDACAFGSVRRRARRGRARRRSAAGVPQCDDGCARVGPPGS
jgi:hypothetical protein